MTTESFDEILDDCRKLWVIYQQLTDRDEDCRPASIVMDLHDGKVGVGVPTGFGRSASFMELGPNHCAGGVGASTLEAIQNWRARLVRAVSKNIAEHEAHKAWLEKRGLLK